MNTNIPQGPAAAAVWGLERRLVRHLLAAVGKPPLAMELWNGEQISLDGVPPRFRIRIRNRRTLWKLLCDPEFQFGEAYSGGWIEADGDLVSLLVTLYQFLRKSETKTRGLLRKWLLRWRHRPHRTTESASKDNIHHHYDIGNDFYKLWLDEQLLYTCAYFTDPSNRLEQAQVDKMDHVCRKLRLRPGDTVVEAGCGWGALALHMARKYGARVRALNISHEQIVYARRRARREGLDDRVEFVEDDWRNITTPCDVFVSVGMLEHVGRNNYRRLGDVINRCLQPGGRGLIHSIGRNRPRQGAVWIERRIFPGGYPPSLREMMDVFEPNEFSVLDVENLRLHYAETLRRWLDRFEQSVDTVREMFDERFVRMWRLYLSGSVAAFENGDLQLFQVLFAKGDNDRLPQTRAYLYAGGEATAQPAARGAAAEA